MGMILLPGSELILVELTNLRKESGYTQNSLAKKLDLSENTLRNWENKLTVPNLNHLVHWAEVLGYEFDLHPIEKRRRRYV